jgi:hypothetical protein
MQNSPVKVKIHILQITNFLSLKHELGEHCRTGNLKKLLRDSIAENRVSHAQLFVGKEGYGTLPMVWRMQKKF